MRRVGCELGRDRAVWYGCCLIAPGSILKFVLW